MRGVDARVVVRCGHFSRPSARVVRGSEGAAARFVREKREGDRDHAAYDVDRAEHHDAARARAGSDASRIARRSHRAPDPRAKCATRRARHQSAAPAATDYFAAARHVAAASAAASSDDRATAAPDDRATTSADDGRRFTDDTLTSTFTSWPTRCT